MFILPLSLPRHFTFNFSADWQMIWTSWLTFATANACRSFYFQRAVAFFRPVCQIISLQITGKEKYTWDIDTYGTWCTVIAATTEIISKLRANLLHLLEFFLCKRCRIRAGCHIFVQFTDLCHSWNHNSHIRIGTDIAKMQVVPSSIAPPASGFISIIRIFFQHICDQFSALLHLQYYMET